MYVFKVLFILRFQTHKPVKRREITNFNIIQSFNYLIHSYSVVSQEKRKIINLGEN